MKDPVEMSSDCVRTAVAPAGPALVPLLFATVEVVRPTSRSLVSDWHPMREKMFAVGLSRDPPSPGEAWEAPTWVGAEAPFEPSEPDTARM
jgi:hypothetical protein